MEAAAERFFFVQTNWLLLKDCYWGKEVRGGKTGSLRLGSRSADSHCQLQLAIISLQQKLGKSKTCNLQRIFQKKDNSAAVGFLFYLKKKKRNQLSRKSNERGGVSFWRIFFCKGTMNIKRILLAGTYIYDFFCMFKSN